MRFRCDEMASEGGEGMASESSIGTERRKVE
jgi:hypothetical protein